MGFVYNPLLDKQEETITKLIKSHNELLKRHKELEERVSKLEELVENEDIHQRHIPEVE